MLLLVTAILLHLTLLLYPEKLADEYCVLNLFWSFILQLSWYDILERESVKQLLGFFVLNKSCDIN